MEKKFNVKYCILLPIVLLVTVFLWCAPKECFGSLGDVLTVTQQRTIAIFAFAALMWIFEIVPNWVTSLMVIVGSLLTISSKSIGFLMTKAVDPATGELAGPGVTEIDGKKYYSFPEPETLAELKPEELQKIARVGYRGDYIVSSAKYYSENPGVYDVLKHTESESEVLKLMKAFKGCGNKVSNCVLLFSGLRRDAFPVDVWVERMLVNLYGLKDMNRLQMEKFGKEYVPEKPNFYSTKKSAQDAHEAIRPTYPERTPDSIKKYLDNDQYKLYKLIWEKFMSSQMAPATIANKSIDINYSTKKNSLIINISSIQNFEIL